MKDLCLTTIDIEDLIQEENDNQLSKWGVQDKSAYKWLGNLTEEVGEVADAIEKYDSGEVTAVAVCKECIQVAALAMKIYEMFYNEYQKSEAVLDCYNETVDEEYFE